MFTIDKARTVEFGKILEKYRTKNNYSFREVHSMTGIDSSTISRLEDGLILRINPLNITALARLYNVNPLIFLNIVGYIEDDDIFEYRETLKQENGFKKDSFIEIFDSMSILSKNKTHLKEFIKLPFLEDESMGLKKDNFIFIYNNKQIIKQEDLGIFSMQDSIFIAYYYSNENNVSLLDYFTNKVTILKNDVKIIGKIITIIDYNLYKK
mgnify:FL=1